MNAEQIRKLIESYPNLIERVNKLLKKMMDSDGGNELQMESIYQRLEKTKEKIELIYELVFDSEVLEDKEEVILNHRMDGYSYEEIGRFFGVHRERIRQTLNKSYEKLESLENVS